MLLSNEGKGEKKTPLPDGPKKCIDCGSRVDLTIHHVYFGKKHRALSNQYRAVEWSCPTCHDPYTGLHSNNEKDQEIKQKHQRRIVSDLMDFYGCTHEAATQKFISLGFIRELQIPLPPLEIQKQITAEIEREQKIVESNKELIEIYEKKIKDKIGEVWGE